MQRLRAVDEGVVATIMPDVANNGNSNGTSNVNNNIRSSSNGSKKTNRFDSVRPTSRSKHLSHKDHQRLQASEFCMVPCHSCKVEGA